MVSSELNKTIVPSDREGSARALGLTVAAMAAVLLMSSRLTPVFLFALLLIWGALRLERLKQMRPEADLFNLALSGFLGYALLSSLWAASFVSGFGIAVMAIAAAAAGMLLTRLVWQEQRPSSGIISDGLWIGFAIGLIYYMIEARTGQAMKIFVYNTLGLGPDDLRPRRFHKWADGQLIAISKTTLTRLAAPMTPLMWPAVMAVLARPAMPWTRWLGAAFYALAVYAFAHLTFKLSVFAIAAATLVFALSFRSSRGETSLAVGLYLLGMSVIFLSPHETSKLAAVVGSLMYLLARASNRWAGNMMRAAWIFACLGVLPAAFLAHKLDLHNAKWLQMSAQHRIIIWNFTAEQVMKQPLFGTGVFTTYKKGPEITKQTVNEPGERYKRKMSRHSHNVYLQTWFEFGLVGALLLLAAGLGLVQRIQALDVALQPFAYAAFASTAILMGSSYGMWQAWFVSLFALTPVFFAVGGRAFELSRQQQA